jgi:hypothetical protein
MVTLNIVSTGTGSTRQNSANNLPPDRRCVQVPPDTQQTAGTLGTIVGIGSALITGNFMPIITNIAGGNNQNPRQGC